MPPLAYGREGASSPCPGLRCLVLVGTAAAPLDPPRIIENLLRVNKSGAFQEDDEVIVGVREPKVGDLLPMPLHGDPPAT